MIPLALLAALLPAAPAQPDLQTVLHRVIGDCRMPSDGSIIICARPQSPYRLPPEARDRGFDVNGSVDSVARERHKLMEVGQTGSGSCSNIGAGGWTGCMVKGWNEADQQRGFRPAGRFKK